MLFILPILVNLLLTPELFFRAEFIKCLLPPLKRYIIMADKAFKILCLP